jgi:Na+-driven multidrug efflux pump
MLAFGKQLLSLYITDSAESIAFGMRRFLFIGPTYFLAGIMEILCATNRGINRAMPSMIISVVSNGLLRIVWIETIFKIPPFNSYDGLLVSFPVCWAICLVLQLVVFAICFKKIMKDKSNV